MTAPESRQASAPHEADPHDQDAALRTVLQSAGDEPIPPAVADALAATIATEARRRRERADVVEAARSSKPLGTFGSNEPSVYDKRHLGFRVTS
ncbi:hypothetical protein [Parenemella sanctibonifatiensis]|uniref:Uncharacterized protein n=1 Tax=Parenemella sanctibonifatiensis TaxID=2016505 RepID=A0A255EH27_9ACTN|nr:hypothetical protein [Parenemella sanctibonifatiensis]OYN83986.1 hypothetical protein CGZ92_13060 [Parenemella sanctibonifatiensis]OYN90271.1 hypothetical protein CGZ91_08905 [Parenemella sanctibonifatiensis]